MSIHELFGGNGVGQGFAKLAAFDSNGDGVVDAHDAHFADLKVWRDANGNQQTDAGELMSLSDSGRLPACKWVFPLPAVDEQGNLHLERSAATLADGKRVDMTDGTSTSMPPKWPRPAAPCRPCLVAPESTSASTACWCLHGGGG